MEGVGFFMADVLGRLPLEANGEHAVTRLSLQFSPHSVVAVAVISPELQRTLQMIGSVERDNSSRIKAPQGDAHMIAEVSIGNDIETAGFVIAEDVLSRCKVDELLLAMEHISDTESVRKRGGIFAVRNLLDVSPEIAELAMSDTIRPLVEPVLGTHFFAVRGILFDKIPDANWKVPWHQDVTIAVREKVEADGFGPWSTKADVLHVQPPASILEKMLTVRLHLDNCGEENGALRVLPGSHTHGKIPEQEIPGLRESLPERVCAVGVGGALLMRPLLLHASSPSRVPGHRRVVHLDFASVVLPAGLQWLSEAS